MPANTSDMDIDNQSEDGEIKKSPSKDMGDYSFSEEEGGDTADSLDIKPPQAVVRHHKSSSSRRREKHSDRRNRRDDKDRKSRQHEREDRHRDKHRHRRHVGEPLERLERFESSKRNRDRMERLDRMESHSRDRESSKHDRKERSTGDRVLEDLRERLLDKRRERREDPRDTRGYKVRLEDLREIRESRDRREVRIEELRERREMHTMDEGCHDGRERREIRIEEQRHIRVIMDEQFSESELIERSEKRRKRSHKHDRVRERDQEKMEHREKEHREKQLREAMEIVTDEINEMDMQNEILMQVKDPKEMTEQELRKERLLEADREMARRKEVSRLELEARRMKRGEKRPMSPDNNPDPSIVELSDESISPHSEGAQSKSAESRHSSEVERSPHERSSERHSSDSSESSSDDDDESNESNKGSGNDSNDGSEYNNPSPLSVDRLAKSDHSDGDSPGHVDSSNLSKNIEEEEKKEEEPELPPYLPAIQGCRSVEEFQCLNRIEEGTYGVVYRARDKRTDEIVALKRLKMEKEKEGFPITSLREINTLLKSQHPNIVTVREIVVGSNMDKIFIVMDYVEHDLKSLIETMKQKKQVFIPGEVKCLMQQLLRAVAHLHDNWILHRDLKTSNLLLSHRGILKVGDFGLAREYGSPLRQYTPIVVTLWYRAPELLLCDKEYAGLYSTPIDMWSVGCIFAELLRMEPLFPGKSDIDQLNKIFKELGTPSERIWPGYTKLPIVQKIPFAHYPVNNLRQRFSLSLSDLGVELLNKFLTYDPRQRVTAEDALNHGYFTEAPLPIDPQMFPTWPAKSEQGSRTTNASPKPPSGGREYKQLGDGDDAELSNSGFHMGLMEGGRVPPVGGGFHLKF
ncbi:cyclin-dependent kinase 11B isoform X4 [Monomorium pharaonis]|uniref:cyclin-dependent kinase 11B isoform X4 n=1 Tax=Monomorium pharaonis TaxID=307658 RepID=UPI00063F9ED1|nr:cyclin-dependent kinase 11B isoform X4 [Monomorium pharaonis]